MNPSYIIYLLTFLIFPLVGLLFSKLISLDTSIKIFKTLAIIFLLHNILFLFGISFIGDYPDYTIFALEYFTICWMVFSLKGFKTVYLQAFRGIGFLMIILGYLQGFFGIFLFIVVSQDFEADKLYQINNEGVQYETRRYTFGFATLIETRYSFETYKKYDFLPFEKLIDKTDLFDLRTDLDFRDEGFKVDVNKNQGMQQIRFSSSNGADSVKVVE